jgi:murein DD-endopeptidase MepM/ murein hydrolase activator NlpD
MRLVGFPLLLVLILVLAPGPAMAAPQPDGFRSLQGSVRPKRSVPLSVEPLKTKFRFKARRVVPVVAEIRRIAGGRLVRRLVAGRLRPYRLHRLAWNGLDSKGRLAAAGRYLIRVGPAGGKLRTLARPKLYGHRFPVLGAHGVRGYIGEFGAPRTGGRTHEGFDVTARCGTPLVAVRSGTVLKSAFDAELKGHYVVLKGRSERRTYLYAHLSRKPSVRKGQQVRAGRRLGTVGQTGNAASTPCHLHIEIRSRDRLLDPEPMLYSWLG